MRSRELLRLWKPKSSDNCTFRGALLKVLFLLLIVGLIFVINPRLNVCAAEQSTWASIEDMTLEEKVYQLFVVEPTSIIAKEYMYTQGSATTRALGKHPVGGFVFFTKHIREKATTINGIQFYQSVMKHNNAPPLLICSDEEGGGVSRIVKRFAHAEFPSARTIGQRGVSAASESGTLAGLVMKEVGFNVNFAPVADIAVTDLSAMRHRSFSDNSDSVAELSSAFVRSLQSHQIAATAKHFPGIGDSSKDTHKGVVEIDTPLTQIMNCNVVPFTRLIGDDIKLIMISHVTYSSLDDGIPATLSKKIVTSLLRNQLGFKGVVVTDALNMKSITRNYSSSEAAVLAINAGCDLLLLPNNLSNAVAGVIKAVETGVISEERIDESVMRIFALKNWLFDQ